MKSPLQKVNTRQRMVTTEEGETEQRPVTLWLDPRGTPRFLFKIPPYVSGNLSIGAEAEGATADLAERAYDTAMTKYRDWARSRAATQVILLDFIYYGWNESGHRIEEGSSFFGGHRGEWHEALQVGLKYQLAFRVNDNIHDRVRDRTIEDEKAPNAYKVGYRINSRFDNVLDYTPELHARIEEICSAINRAAIALHGIQHSKNVAATLMSTKLLSNKEA